MIRSVEFGVGLLKKCPPYFLPQVDPDAHKPRKEEGRT